MRITGFHIIPYALPLTEAVTWGGEAVRQREGWLLRLDSEEGLSGWGDAAPLPGFSSETPAETRRALEVLGAALSGQDIDPAQVLLPFGAIAHGLDAMGHPPSARFAFDLALADLAAQVSGRTLPQILHPDPEVSLPLNGLLMGEADRVLADAERLADAGYTALKLKVGRGDLESEAYLVQALRQRVGAGIELRLDANRAWSMEQAAAFAEAIDGASIAYIEEPLADASELPVLWHDTGMPVAVDESVQENGEEAIRGWAAAAVLKPTLLGGLAKTLRMALHARSVGVRPVLSAAFESSVGLRGVAALAAATGAEPAGLDTARWLAADVLATPLPFDRPRVDIPSLFASPIHVTL
ncbi:MAG: o-succinylbenzoate synthase [Rubricoccaceae bacterium]